jgi:hypothetical protein
MPDSPAQRARRHRAHVNGDHVWCKPGRCSALPATLAELDPPPEVGPVEGALRLFADSLTVRNDDPRNVITQAALRLGRALDEAPGKETAAISRELRVYVGYMADFGQQPDQLDELRAKRALSRVDSVLSSTTGER